MTKNVSRRILLLIVLYVSIIFGIFAVQFTKGTLFSRTIGDLVISAGQESDASGVPVPVLPVQAAAYGVNFFLDENTPVLAYTSGNTAVELKVTEISSDDTSFSLSFDDGSRVSFSPGRRGDIRAIEIRASVSGDYRALSLPFKLTRSARVEPEGSLPVIRSGKQRFAFTGAAFVHDDTQAVQRVKIEASAPTVYYQTWIPAKGVNLEVLVHNPAATEEHYRQNQDRFASAVLPLFRAAISSGSLNEKTVTAYIAEMGRIGMYQTALDAVPDAFKRGTARTYLSSPFLNTLERSWQSMIARDREERSLLSRQFTENNLRVFEFPHLVPYLVDRGSTVFLDDIIRVASAVDLSTLTPLQAAGLLEIMQDMQVYSPQRSDALLLLAETCERVIRESLVQIQDTLYVTTGGTLIDSYATFRIAHILRRYGTMSTATAPWQHAGTLLYTSLLSRAENDAVLPVSFESAVTGGAATGIPVAGDRKMPVEDLYPLVMNENTWYPRAVSLSREVEPGVWAWTAARSITYAGNPDGSVRYRVQFPRGQSHYLVLNGIGQFTRIQLYGMDFRTDPRFESYNSSGYRYNAETRTLFLKMRHRDEFEDIVIYHGIPEEPEAEPAPEEAAVQSSVPAEAGTEEVPAEAAPDQF